MTRVVLDTNVLAPGFTSRGSASNQLINRWRAGEYALIVSEHILAELARAFLDPYYRARVSFQQAERTLLRSGRGDSDPAERRLGVVHRSER